MYETYWRLKQKPFENAADPRFYYPGQSHQAALLKLRYAVENRRGAALLAGPSGAGKTLLTVMLRGALDAQFAPFVHLVFPQMSTAELLAYLAEELDGDSRAGFQPAAARRRRASERPPHPAVPGRQRREGPARRGRRRRGPTHPRPGHLRGPAAAA